METKRSSERQGLLDRISEFILSLPSSQVLKVAVDGVDGAGKSFFASELATVLRRSRRQIITASVDGFHNPKAIRYRLGKTSPQGFFFDSYNYAGLRESLLDPLCFAGNRRIRLAIFDHITDSAVDSPATVASDGAILVFDGIFLHRDELRAYWDCSVFLDVGFEVSIPRGAQRGIGSPDPGAESNRRYVEGQKVYLETCKPQDRASILIDNNRLEAPVVRRFLSQSY